MGGEVIEWIMAQRWTVEEIEREMARAVDEHGEDVGLVADVARMTPEERARSRANLEACAAEVRASLRRRPPRDRGGA